MACAYVNAAAIGVPITEWLTLPDHTRRAIITEHNSRHEP